MVTYIWIWSFICSRTSKGNKFVAPFVDHKTANYNIKISHKYYSYCKFKKKLTINFISCNLISQEYTLNYKLVYFINFEIKKIKGRCLYYWLHDCIIYKVIKLSTYIKENPHYLFINKIKYKIFIRYNSNYGSYTYDNIPQ